MNLDFITAKLNSEYQQQKYLVASIKALEDQINDAQRKLSYERELKNLSDLDVKKFELLLTQPMGVKLVGIPFPTYDQSYNSEEFNKAQTAPPKTPQAPEKKKASRRK